MTKLEIRDLTPGYGAEVIGLDPSTALADDDIELLRTAFDERSLLLFRGLDIDDTYQQYLAKLVIGHDGPTGDGQDVEKLNSTAFHPPNGFNVGWYESKQVEDLLVEARAAPDPAVAARTYQQIERILNEDVARIYVLHSLQPKAFNKKVRGFVNPHSWAYTFTNVWLAP